MCTASNMTCRNFEKDFKKIVKSKDLQEAIIYLNLSNLDQEKFVQDFNKKYPHRIKLKNAYPALVVFEEGEIINLLQGKVDEKLTIIKTKQFIEIHKIGE